MTSPDQSYSPAVAIFWMVVTGLMFVCVTGLVRYIGSDIPAPEAAFIRYVFGLVFLLPALIPALKGGVPKRLLLAFSIRGLAHALGVILWFYAMARIPIAEVVAIGYTAPIYITLGAVLFMGERMAIRRVLALIAAFVGAMIIVRPGFQVIETGQIAQLVSAPLFAVSYLMAKSLSGKHSPTLIVGMLSVFVTLALAPFAIAVWETPSLTEIVALAFVAAFATAGHITMTYALRAAPLMVTQPVTFLQLVWATMLGSIVFGEAVDFYVLLGGGVIIAAVSFISYREWVLKRAAKTPPAVATKF